MPGTNFLDKNTVITAAYMNSVDRAVYDAIGNGSNTPSTATEVKINLGLDQVNNTLDVNKPISNDTQTALDLKVDKDSNTGAANIPIGTTAQRPVSPVQGMLRRNSQLSQWEGYDGSNWTGIGGASGGGGNPFCYENDIHVTANYSITSGKNAMRSGPITVDNGATVTVP